MKELNNFFLSLKNKIKFFTNKENKHYVLHIIILIACVLLFISLGLFIELTEDLIQHDLNHFDTLVSSYIWKFKTDEVTNFMLAVTHIGDSIGYIFIVLGFSIYFIWDKKWKISVQITSVLLISSILNLVLKSIFNRNRPTNLQMVFADSSSYPSGHAMSAMAFYGFMAYLSLQFLNLRSKKIACFTLCCFLILSIGISRIYLGVHYPSDVLAGYFAGLICLTFYIIIFNLLTIHKQIKK